MVFFYWWGGLRQLLFVCSFMGRGGGSTLGGFRVGRTNYIPSDRKYCIVYTFTQKYHFQTACIKPLHTAVNLIVKLRVALDDVQANTKWKLFILAK